MLRRGLQKKAVFQSPTDRSLHSPVGEVSSSIKAHSVGSSKYHYMVMLLPFPVFHSKFEKRWTFTGTVKRPSL